MDTKNLNALYDLDDKANQLLKNLYKILDDAHRLGVPLAYDDADNLYMRLRVVLGVIGDHATSHDEQAQFEANPWMHNAPVNSQFLGAQPARSGEDY